MTRYVVGARGCDDSTYALVELTDAQAEGFRLALEAVNPRADYSCKPELFMKSEDEAAGSYQLERALEGTSEEADQ